MKEDNTSTTFNIAEEQIKSIETTLATVFALNAERFDKLGKGATRAVVLQISGHTLIQASMNPLVLALICNSNNTNETNTELDVVLDNIPALCDVLDPLRKAAEDIASGVNNNGE